MQRKPIRIANPKTFSVASSLRQDEAFLWLENDLLKCKLFNDANTYDFSGVHIVDSLGTRMLVSPKQALLIKGDFIKQTFLQIEDDKTLSLRIDLNINAKTIADLLLPGNQETNGLIKLSDSIDNKTTGQSSVAATPWNVNYLKQYVIEHTSIKKIISPVNSKSALPTPAEYGSYCVTLDTNDGYLFSKFCKAPTLTGTYKRKGWNDTYPDKPIMYIALADTDIEFIHHKNIDNILKNVYINSAKLELKEIQEPAEVLELFDRYDIPVFMKSHLKWFQLMTGNIEGAVSGANVYIEQWEISMIPSFSIPVSNTGWKTL